jgi:ESCRT-II complex subunit VPS36
MPNFVARNVKAANHQSGSIYVTSHRLIYIDGVHPRKRSLEFQLQSITQTEYYVGFLTSSSKITITFKSSGPATYESGEINSASRSPAGTSTPLRERETVFKWDCEICGNKNVTVGLTPSLVCQLCGVPRTASASTEPQSAEPRSIPIGRRLSFSKSSDVLSKSLPSTSLPSPRRAPSPYSPHERRGRDADTPDVGSGGDEVDGQIACPVCTFLNFPSLRNCEMCGTPLPKLGSSTSPGSLRPSATGSRTMKSAPASRPSSPPRQKVPEEFRNIMKISFRRGGDKVFYTALKNALDAKVWAVVEPALPSKNRTGIRKH